VSAFPAIVLTTISFGVVAGSCMAKIASQRFNIVSTAKVIYCEMIWEFQFM
jgi:hypothetical protein